MTRLSISLLLLRLGVFYVLFIWTLDKFLFPEHTAKVWAKFYFVDNIETSVSYGLGAVQMAIILVFVVGAFKRFSYGAVLLMPGVSTLSTWYILINPYGQTLLFMAAVPMLSACIALYLLREDDRLLSVS